MGVTVKVEVMSGEQAGTRVEVPVGGAVRVGRVRPAEVLVTDDPLLSGLHFAVECDGQGCRLRDLGSRFGTFCRGQAVTAVDLRDGDLILAGRTRFSVSVAGADAVAAGPAPAATGRAENVPPIAAAPLPPPLPPPPPPESGPVRDWLRGLPEPLFAVLDAAREPTIPERLARSGQPFRSLFDGDLGAELAPFGPWLVSLSKQSKLLDELTEQGWGKSWGVYLTCTQPLDEVRRQLRRFLLVKLPDGRQVYFRYYDPRVLRTYLPTCTPDERRAFFGPVERILVEADSPDAAWIFFPGQQVQRSFSGAPTRPVGAVARG